jgi:hypothetical protein
MQTMPRKPIDFSKTMIYKIVCKNTELCDKLYIGRTTNFALRKNQHKSDAKKNFNTSNAYVYKIINEFGGWDNWEMQLIENYPCTNSDEASERESYYIGIFRAELNTTFSINKEIDQSIYKQEWYIKNRARLAEKYKNNHIDYVYTKGRYKVHYKSPDYIDSLTQYNDIMEKKLKIHMYNLECLKFRQIDV